MTQAHTETTTAIAREAECTPQYVCKLARAQLIPHIVASNGVHLFSPEVIPLVRRIKADRLAARGRHPRR